MASAIVTSNIQCFHCGEDCGRQPVKAHDKSFCCQGCKMVYEILSENDLCEYYNLSANPGASQKHRVREGKFAFLDDEKIATPLITYKDAVQTHVCFYLPQIHCSSCLWLLENLHKLNEHILGSKVNFTRKEVEIIFNHQKVSLRKTAELLAGIGYEPYISLGDMKGKKPVADKSKIYKLGVAGFCFANIMLLSFPEYFGIDAKEASLAGLFRVMNVLLSLPVVFYSASEFYISAYKSLRHRFLNIDAPIVLAILVTFVRSMYEVVTGAGAGYFDSMTGIVFFMLAGRVLQDKTYGQLNFDRDYTAYFPVAVTRLANSKEEPVSLPEIKLNDTLLIHNSELVPADGILTRGSALIDYSFVTGETTPVLKEMGEIIYAGGRQTGGNIEMLVIKEVAQSYLTRLWNRDTAEKDKQDANNSFVHFLSRWFTWIVLSIAAVAALYWFIQGDTHKVWSSVTAVLIVACPCALLLSNTFTNGNILRILSRNGFYLRNAQTIESIAGINHIVFDKTGTLTTGSSESIEYEGQPLTAALKNKVAALASQSVHPASKAIAKFLRVSSIVNVQAFKETAGKGIEGFVDGDLIMLGSKSFVLNDAQPDAATTVYLAVEGRQVGLFRFRNQYRQQVPQLLSLLKNKYPVTILSGDNEGEKQYLRQLLGSDAVLRFNQQPADKLLAIELLQEQGKKVLMAGDGLNDAGALQQANAGIAITDNSNNFTPASDAILEAGKLPLLQKFITLCKINQRIVLASFVVSILYNIVGISYAVQGNLSPVIAAILMPASSLSILLVTFGLSQLAAKALKLR
ncbi:heavy metal translocating P-type ATPase [Foetidibacter luteolus]|uniref:heavy metal translocating P-type ATPase n=1 Tax=Foetidibacter luteolus TaxID=2608880 RepID=UPI00129AE0E1|nr:heavy metal translocating P-type ATPase metal-binding domain-containing protein [Foetidibacter luteolus]